MNILFISDRGEAATRLNKAWDSCVHRSEEGARQGLKDIPVDLRQLRVRRAGLSGNGRLQIPENELFAGDGVVIDAALTGRRTEEAVAEAKKRLPRGVAVVVLYEAENTPEAMKALRAGAADCIAMGEGYETRLALTLAREARYQTLGREKEEILVRESRLRRVVESLPLGLVLLARNGAILYINRAGLKIFGFSEPGSVLGRAIQDLAGGDHRERIGTWLEAIRAGDDRVLSAAFIGANGRPSGVTLRAAKLEDQGLRGPAMLLTLHSEREAPDRETVEQVRIDHTKRLRDLQNSQAAQRIEWEAVLDSEQSRRMEAERGRSALEAALGKAEQSLEQAKAEYDSERGSWEKMKQSLENRVREAEEKQVAVETALRETSDRLSAIEKAIPVPERETESGNAKPCSQTTERE